MNEYLLVLLLYPASAAAVYAVLRVQRVVRIGKLWRSFTWALSIPASAIVVAMFALKEPLFALPAGGFVFSVILLGGLYRAKLATQVQDFLKPRFPVDDETRLTTEEHVNFGPPRLK